MPCQNELRGVRVSLCIFKGRSTFFGPPYPFLSVHVLFLIEWSFPEPPHAKLSGLSFLIAIFIRSVYICLFQAKGLGGGWYIY